MPHAPRGTTVRIVHSDDARRKKPWGVCWNIYKPGFAGRAKQASAWCATEAEAEAFAAKLRAGLAADGAPPATLVAPVHRQADSLAALAGFDYTDATPPVYTGWLQWVEDQREAATLANYRDCVKNYLAPAKGHKRYPGLGDLIVRGQTIEWPMIKPLLVQLREQGARLSMRKRLHSALSAFFTWAKGEGLLKGANPCQGMGKTLRMKGEAKVKPEPNPFEGEEVTRIFDQLTAAEDPCWVVYFRFLLDVGCRVGEAAALKWTAVDLDKRKARIELSYSSAAKGDKLPKTHEVREVDLTQREADLLLAWKVDQAREAMRRGRRPPVYVFTTRRLTRCLPNKTVRQVFTRTLAACKITGHTPHDFRDTFATSHLIGSWDRKLAWVSKQLGHSTPRTTETFYYKYRNIKAAAAFADEIVAYEQ